MPRYWDGGIGDMGLWDYGIWDGDTGIWGRGGEMQGPVQKKKKKDPPIAFFFFFFFSTGTA